MAAGGAPTGAASGVVRLSRVEARRILALRRDLSLNDEQRELFDSLDDDGESPVAGASGSGPFGA